MKPEWLDVLRFPARPHACRPSAHRKRLVESRHGRVTQTLRPVRQQRVSEFGLPLCHFCPGQDRERRIFCILRAHSAFSCEFKEPHARGGNWAAGLRHLAAATLVENRGVESVIRPKAPCQNQRIASSALCRQQHLDIMEHNTMLVSIYSFFVTIGETFFFPLEALVVSRPAT